MSRVSHIESSSSLWQDILCNNVTCPNELCDILQLSPSVVSTKAIAVQPLNVTRDFLSRIETGNPDDPLLLQILPSHNELIDVPGFSHDPLEEMDDLGRVSPKNKNSVDSPHFFMEQNFAGQLPVLQKYPGRVLVLTMECCATNCRFCFRRHFSNYTTNCQVRVPRHSSLTNLASVFAQKTDETNNIREIVLSGGDPLMLDDTKFEGVFNYIRDSQSGNRVRLHTRLPVMLPERVTPQLIKTLHDFRAETKNGPVYLVLHVNHARELSEKVIDAVAKIIDSGIPVLSQTVLLRRVNDDFETLFDLFEKLIDYRIIPYYLHQLDKIQGVSHFEVPMVKGAELVAKLRAALPGYAVPRYVREISGLSQKNFI